MTSYFQDPKTLFSLATTMQYQAGDQTPQQENLWNQDGNPARGVQGGKAPQPKRNNYDFQDLCKDDF